MRLAAYVHAEDLGPTGVDRQQRGEHLEHGGLAGTVGAEHTEDLTLVDVQVDAVDGTEVTEGLHQTFGVTAGMFVMIHSFTTGIDRPEGSMRGIGCTAPTPRFHRVSPGVIGPPCLLVRSAGPVGAHDHHQREADDQHQ